MFFEGDDFNGFFFCELLLGWVGGWVGKVVRFGFKFEVRLFISIFFLF